MRAAPLAAALVAPLAIAFSLVTRRHFEFGHAAEFARALVKAGDRKSVV